MSLYVELELDFMKLTARDGRVALAHICVLVLGDERNLVRHGFYVAQSGAEGHEIDLSATKYLVDEEV